MDIVAQTTEGRPRTVELESAVNFRDIGGYRAGESRTRWGLVYRADNCSHLTDSDVETLRRLGISSVLDLRTSFEVDGGRFPTEALAVTMHHFPLLDELPDPERFTMAPGVLASQYEEITERAAPRIGQALKALAAPGALPAVVHCTAGKDRTGIVMALLLSLLGVDDEVVVADYALSGEAMGRLRAALVERYPEGREVIEGADEMFSADPTNMEQLLATLRRRHGSIEAYAASAGAGEAVVVALRERLLEPAP